MRISGETARSAKSVLVFKKENLYSAMSVLSLITPLAANMSTYVSFARKGLRILRKRLSALKPKMLTFGSWSKMKSGVVLLATSQYAGHRRPAITVVNLLSEFE